MKTFAVDCLSEPRVEASRFFNLLRIFIKFKEAIIHDFPGVLLKRGELIFNIFTETGAVLFHQTIEGGLVSITETFN